jgi:glutathione S-transferase
MPTIVLHQWEMSPFCNKVRRCLRHKGLSFDVHDYNGLEARRAASLSEVGTLPVLEYDGERVVDSTAIARFLEQKHADAPLFPPNSEELAMVRFWDDWAGQSLYFFEIYFRMLDPVAMEKALDLICKGRPGYERALMKFVFQRRYPKKLAAQGLGRLAPSEVERQLGEHLDGLDSILAKRDWLVGSRVSLADLSVASQLDELLRTSRMASEIRARPQVARWLERLPDGS